MISCISSELVPSSYKKLVKKEIKIVMTPRSLKRPTGVLILNLTSLQITYWELTLYS